MAFNLFNRKQKRDQAVTPMVVQPQQPVQQPQFAAPEDGNYIGLINDMLGPTPAEREAQQRRLAENKAKMSGWLGLFQGLGALGDLYYANKGVNPSQPNYQPQQLLNQHYAEEQQRLDNLYKNRQAYATMLYNMKRQAGEDARKDKLADAQAKWYDTRDEMARLKGENDKLKAEQQAQLNEARKKKIDLQMEQMKEMQPYKLQNLMARTKSALHNAGRPYSSSRGGGSRGGSTTAEDMYELAYNIENNLDVTAPILEEMGMGYYDKDGQKFVFRKKATATDARQANRRTNIRRGKITAGRPVTPSNNPKPSAKKNGSKSNKSGFFNK